MDGLLLATGDPTGFEISQTLLVVVSLLIPSIIFLISTFKDETKIEGPIKDLISYAPSSFGKSLGLQALIVAILVIAINLSYVLFTVLFTGIFQISIDSVGFFSGIGIVLILLYLLLMVWSLSTNGGSPSQVEQTNDDVNKAILEQQNEYLQEQLSQRKQEISKLVTNFKKLEIQLNRQDNMPDTTQELIDKLTDVNEVEEAEDDSTTVQRENPTER